MSDDDWRRAAPTCEPLDWQPLWADERHGGWQVQVAERETDGWTRPNLRLVLGDEERRLAGAVCVCVRRDGRTGDGPAGAGDADAESQDRVLLVLQDRPAPGVRLWELPRGMVDPDDASPAASALRELAEETGSRASVAADLGEVYPDTGVFGGSVAVVLAELTRDGDPDEDEPEVEATRWFTRTQLDELVARGELRDGISLAALTLARVHRARTR
ncbi:NUDIX hydrolase [Arsenicicoccus dermatophilus]|uniref:NUDIX hydrolase n=1 Tax=Arsenicicoccus dermatophilus TaxID=1076331 RepID=UPI001F4CD7AB|nr:NUDIX hydrolase [Arsenicicoccus dermatophilus]